MCDETKHTLRVHGGVPAWAQQMAKEGLKKAKQSGKARAISGKSSAKIHTWQVCVVKRTLHFVASKGPCVLNLIMPPVPMKIVSADRLLAVLFSQGVGKVITGRVDALLETAQYKCKIRETDQARSNKRMLAWELSTTPLEVLYFVVWCTMHINHLITGSILWAWGLTKINSMYCGSLLLHSGTFFSSLIANIPKWLHHKTFRVASWPPSEKTVQHNRRIMDLLRPHARTGRDGDVELSDLHLRFLDFFNGCWCSGQVVHHCRGASCPHCGGDSQEAFRVACHLIHMVLFSALPVVPVLSRWTKVIDTFDFWLLGACFYGILHGLVQISWNDEDVWEYDESDGFYSAAADGEEDFKSLRGKRFKRLMAMLEGPHMAFDMLVGSIILNCSRYVGAWVLKETMHQRKSSEVPPACDMANDEYSPAHVVLQYLSSLLDPTNAWHVVLGAFVGGPAAWVDEFQHDFRRLVAHSACHFHRRHQSRFRRYPLRCAKLVDTDILLYNI